jgi:hypothetical protein
MFSHDGGKRGCENILIYAGYGGAYPNAIEIGPDCLLYAHDVDGFPEPGQSARPRNYLCLCMVRLRAKHSTSRRCGKLCFLHFSPPQLLPSRGKALGMSMKRLPWRANLPVSHYASRTYLRESHTVPNISAEMAIIGGLVGRSA